MVRQALVERMLARRLVPCAFTIRRARFFLDAAIAVTMRDEFFGDTLPLYLWADSSPQGSLNWNLAQFHRLESNDPERLLSLVLAIDTLSPRACRVRHDEESGEDSDGLSLDGSVSDNDATPDVDEPNETLPPSPGMEVDDADQSGPSVPELATAGKARASPPIPLSPPGNAIAPSQMPPSTSTRRLTRCIFKMFSWHCPTPCALGSGSEKLSDKAACICHSVRLECRSQDQLEAALSRCVSITTDMGTELGLSDVIKGTFSEWFPEALRAVHSIECDAGGDSVSAVAQESGPGPGMTAFMFGRAIPVPGLLHVLDNATQQINQKSLKFWPRFENHLRCLCKLLCRRHSRDRFIRHCLEERSAPAHICAQFKHEFKSIVEWRWGTLFQVLRWLLPLRLSLRIWWSSEHYLHGESIAAQRENADGVDAPFLTSTIASALFWTYCSMCLELQTVLEHIRFWAESCPCHGPSLTEIIANPRSGGRIRPPQEAQPRKVAWASPWDVQGMSNGRHTRTIPGG